MYRTITFPFALVRSRHLQKSLLNEKKLILSINVKRQKFKDSFHVQRWTPSFLSGTRPQVKFLAEYSGTGSVLRQTNIKPKQLLFTRDAFLEYRSGTSLLSPVILAYLFQLHYPFFFKASECTFEFMLTELHPRIYDVTRL